MSSHLSIYDRRASGLGQRRPMPPILTLEAPASPASSRSLSRYSVSTAPEIPVSNPISAYGPKSPGAQSEMVISHRVRDNRSYTPTTQHRRNGGGVRSAASKKNGMGASEVSFETRRKITTASSLTAAANAPSCSNRSERRMGETTCDCHDRDYPPWTGEIHGMSQALLSKSFTLRVFWWVVLVLCTSCGTATTVLVIIEYVNGPTATSTTIRLVSSLELPAITVCPKVPDAFNFDELYAEMRIALPELGRETALDLIRFWLGGSGLENMDELPEFNRTYLESIAQLYDVWSTGYDAQTFFDLQHARFGYKCQDLFQYCELGGKPQDCCKSLFRRRAVMRRGFCYQTLRNVNQTEIDDIGRLMLSLKALPSITSPQYNYAQPQYVVYINDNHEHVLDFPRFYLYPNEWNRMHFTARRMELLEHPRDCTERLVGKDSNCFVRNWLMGNVVESYNCTVPYLTHVEGVPPRPTCKPRIVAREYYHAIQLVHSGSVHSHQCIPGCTRWEYGVILQQSPSLTHFTGYAFNLEASFYDLQYEHVKEVYTISVPGFMSQIGGQFGFFLGLSIITMIQIIIYSLSLVIQALTALARRLCNCILAKLRALDTLTHNSQQRMANENVTRWEEQKEEYNRRPPTNEPMGGVSKLSASREGLGWVNRAITVSVISSSETQSLGSLASVERPPSSTAASRNKDLRKRHQPDTTCDSRVESLELKQLGDRYNPTNSGGDYPNGSPELAEFPGTMWKMEGRTASVAQRRKLSFARPLGGIGLTMIGAERSEEARGVGLRMEERRKHSVLL